MIITNHIRFGAGFLAALAAGVHAFFGSPSVQASLFQSARPERMKLLLLSCRHLGTATFLLSAVVLVTWLLRSGPTRSGDVRGFIAALWPLFALVPSVVALASAGPSALLTLPQWALLASIGILAWLGARRQNAILRAAE